MVTDLNDGVTAATDCLYSTVKNTGARKLFFGFLPPHGHHLDVNEEMNIFGDIREAVVRGERVLSARYQNSLAAALDAGDMTILQTPAPILYDTEDVDQTPKMLVLVNGALGVTTPCWAPSIT